MIDTKKIAVAVLVCATFAAGTGTGAIGKDVLAWRFKLYGKKALGELPEVEWSELLALTAPWNHSRLGQDIEEGRSLHAAVDNPHVGVADITEGEQLFQTHCAACHGPDGSGGAGPSLLTASYRHGDSSFAIYRVLRDGIPQTPMVPARLDATERWQVVAYLRSLQKQPGGAFRFVVPTVHVASEDLVGAGDRADQWITYSGNLKGWRYSSLSDITPANASKLRLIWTRQFPTDFSVQESTPLIAGGTMFVSESPSNAVALNVRTGELLWRLDRTLPAKLPVCCGRVNRGMAILNDLVYIATLDAQVVAMDANTGAVRWQTRVADPAAGYTMTVAPLAFGNTVVVGVSGGEYGIRGFLVAYDAATGAERWRFNTIPGPGESGHETWSDEAWRTGGGPTWVTGSYDADLDILYWGVGNPAPDYQGAVRPGNNLYTDSVIALRGTTGELVWHFQFTPHDEHDWDSNQTPILTDLEINGRTRKVICWANRNGFYYVLDRESGEFLQGAPFVKQNWTEGLDVAGRPVLSASGRVSASGRLTYPGVGGGTNWYPAAFDPVSRLIFVHANEQGSVFTQTSAEQVETGEGGFYVASGAVNPDPPVLSVRALDAATGAIRWAHDEPAPTTASGFTGLLATRGGLVFGATGGQAFALDSSTGRQVWAQRLGGNTHAPPISFSLDGRQVVAIWGGRALFLFGL